MPHDRRHLLVLVVLVAVFTAALAGPASAHRNDESYVYLDIGDDDLRGRVELPYPDLRSVFAFDLVGSEDEVRAEIEDRLGELQAYARRTTALGAGEAWTLDFADYDLLEEGDVDENGLGYVILPFVVALPDGEVPPRIEVGFTPFLDEIPDRNNIALIANDWTRGVISEEANELIVFDAGNRTGVIDLGDSSQWKNFTASIELGIDHIKTGPDHIFFILVLLLPSVLILRAGRWEPAPQARTALIRVLIVATMFTLAHSITFTLAGLDLIPTPPARLTESVIALSIAVAALNNLWPIIGHREWAIAFVFGLFHGLGFAGFVEDLEITRTTQLVSLLGRNVGIEIGQAVIIFLTFPALFLLSRTRAYRIFYPAATLALAGVSLIWVVERVVDADVGINDTIDTIVQWPRVAWLCVLATALIGAYVAWERQQGRLVTTGAADSAAAPDDAEPVGADR